MNKTGWFGIFSFPFIVRFMLTNFKDFLACLCKKSYISLLVKLSGFFFILLSLGIEQEKPNI